MANYVQTELTSLLDKETGEVIQQELKKKWTCKYKSDSFYRVYFDWVPYERLLTNQAKSVMTWLCTKAEYNTGKVYLPTQCRVEICEELSISNNRLTNILKELRKIGAIQGDRGVYIINPQLFWIGDQQVRDKILKDSEIEFSISIKPDLNNTSFKQIEL